MEVAKITLHNGHTFYTNDLSKGHQAFFNNKHSQIELIKMTPEEYQAIPATVESAKLFGSSK